MKITFLIAFLFLASFSSAQDFQVGFQGGGNISFSFVEGEELKPCTNFGYSLGVYGRYDTRKKMKLKWGKFKTINSFFLESGLQIVGQGVSYKYADLPIRHDYQRLELPVLLVIKGDNRRLKKMRKKNWYPIVKLGFVFSTQSATETTSSKSWGNDYFIQEHFTRSNDLNIGFLGGVGYQKEYKDKSILYIGYTWVVAFRNIIHGNMTYRSNNQILTGNLSKRGDYFALNVQYFYGFPEDERTIYNPRF